LTDLDGWWVNWFKQNGFSKEPDVLLAVVKPGDAPVQSACMDQSGTVPLVSADYPGLFYCPGNAQFLADGRLVAGQIFIPVNTLARMWDGDIIGNPSRHAGDFAAAIAVAHEFGHHIADELRQAWLVNPPTGKYNELLADCFAGNWTAHIYYAGLLEPGDFEEGVAALEAVGDKGVSPDPHGTPAERAQAMTDGYNSTDPLFCTNTYWR
jgi:hypothetical protein